jgi:HEAT repeat protein
MTQGNWDNSTQRGPQAGETPPSDAPSQNAAPADLQRLMLFGLAGLVAFLIALIGAVLLARHLRPLVHKPSEAERSDQIDAWIVRLRQDPDMKKRQAAAARIVEAGEAAVAQTLDATAVIVGEGDSFNFPATVIRLLADTGPTSAPLFARALRHDKPNVRAGAAYVLREMGEKASGSQGATPQPEIVAALTAAVQDTNRWARWYSIETLGNLGPGAAPAVNDLAGLLSHRDAQTRLRAVRALGRMGDAARSTAPRLAQLQEQENEVAVRRAAAEAILDVNLPGLAASARERASETVRELIVRLANPNEFESVSAANELGRLGNDAADAVPALAQALDHPQKWVRVAAADALAALGASGVDVQMVAPRLQKTALDADPDVRAAAEKAVQRIRPTDGR